MGSVMFSTEKHLSNWLKKATGGHWVRIENNVGTGVPDVNYAFQGTEGWTELKVCRRKIITYDTVIKLKVRPAQYAWLMERHKYNGNCSITIGFTQGFVMIVPPENLRLLMEPEGARAGHLGLLIEATKSNWPVIAAQYKRLYEDKHS